MNLELSKKCHPDMVRTLDFKTKVNDNCESQVNDNYEIFITRNVYKDDPEFVIKLFTDGKWIHYLKKYLNDCNKSVVDEFVSSESSFYEKYMKLDEFLDNAVFFNKHYINGLLVIYMCYGTVIYITNNGMGTIKVGGTSDLELMDNYSYYPYKYGSKYYNKNALKNDIYDDFKKCLDSKYRQTIECNTSKKRVYTSSRKGR
ncbi:unknown [Mycoplasma sp. CAG:472]|nr:unknown [Mycoplasma sp. CAG:472]